MTPDPIVDFIVSEFLSGTQPGDVSADQPLLSSGIIDSVGAMKLVLFLERTYGVEIDADDIMAGHLDTLRAITTLVADKQGARGRATA